MNENGQFFNLDPSQTNRNIFIILSSLRHYERKLIIAKTMNQFSGYAIQFAKDNSILSNSAKDMTPLLLLLLFTSYCYGLPEGFVYTGDLNLTHPIVVSLRYGTDQNFVGGVVRGYESIPSRGAVVTAEAGAGLAEAQKEFVKNGFQIVIYDSYRPSKAVDHFMEWAANGEDNENVKRYFYPNVEKSSLFDLGYIAARSGHSRGSTIDRNLDFRTTLNFLFLLILFTQSL